MTKNLVDVLEALNTLDLSADPVFLVESECTLNVGKINSVLAKNGFYLDTISQQKNQLTGDTKIALHIKEQTDEDTG